MVVTCLVEDVDVAVMAGMADQTMADVVAELVKALCDVP